MRDRAQPQDVQKLFEEVRAKQRRTGRVKFYNQPRGYGIIEAASGDVFFHSKALKGFEARHGQQVKFESGIRKDGRILAVKVWQCEGADGNQLVNKGRAG